MCTGERVWDGEILDNLLNDRDKHLIQNVMLSDEVGPDQHYWNMEASGNYSVKSAYNYLQRLHGRWNEPNNFGFWRSLWNLKIPANVKHLLWRACMGILPTSTQLRQKHMDVTIECQFCRGDEESIMHNLVECPFASLCWHRH